MYENFIFVKPIFVSGLEVGFERFQDLPPYPLRPPWYENEVSYKTSLSIETHFKYNNMWF